ncbi:MAG: type II secretion system protein M [Alphaproteobacteria bacterium]|nr:type II secretion system protein M [Alphaproteobacteria bacterium]
MIKTWWGGLAQRERLLISIAGILLGLVIIWQFIFVPARRAHGDAVLQLQTSSQMLSRLQEEYMELRAVGGLDTVPTERQTVTAEAFKTSVTRAATDKGLSITRLQGGDGSNVGLVFERADPRLVFVWLEEVESRLGGQVTRLTMEQVDAGAVRVSVDIEGNAN